MKSVNHEISKSSVNTKSVSTISMKSWNHFLFSWTVPLFSTQQKSQVGPIYPRNLTVSWLSPWKASPCFHRRPEVVLQGNLLFVCPLQSGVTTRELFPKFHTENGHGNEIELTVEFQRYYLSLSLYMFIFFSFKVFFYPGSLPLQIPTQS